MHAFQNGTRGHYICTFLHKGLATSAKKCKFCAQVAILKVKCKKCPFSLRFLLNNSVNKILFLDKNINRTFLHALLSGTRGHKSSTFLHSGQAPHAKKCYFYAQGCHLKVKCKKVLFNICCQDEVFLPRHTFFPLMLKKVDMLQLKKITVICQIIHKFEQK